MLTAVARSQGERPSAPRAAVVNGEVIPEAAVQRALKGIPLEQQAAARSQVLNLLIGHALVEQHLVQLKVDAPAKEVETRMAAIREEAKKRGVEYEKFLAQYALSDAEIRAQITADLRWETHVASKAPDDVLVKFFAENKNWFDGSQVNARHILVEVSAQADAATRQAAVTKLQQIKQAIDTRVSQELARLDAKLDNLAREQARLKATNDAFVEAAMKHSDCPSKKHGGDLGFFPRVGAMVEPFAKAAFGLQPGQMAGPVETQFGYHLILVTARMPGKEVKFDDIKDEVRETYSDRMREELVAELWKKARIEVLGPPPMKAEK
jgi:parvulin-like peptidyl-prolyl isomerase